MGKRCVERHFFFFIQEEKKIVEQTIAQIIQQFWPQIWMGFVTLIITGFVMLMVKNFVTDLVLYFKVRMSDLGKGAMILWRNKLKMVKAIHFKYIEVYDDEEVIYIPIKTWMNADRIYPKPWDGQFSEEKWKHWDGKTDRRRVDHLNGDIKGD